MTKFEEFVSTRFTIHHKNGDEVTSIIESGFSSLPKRAELKTSEIGAALFEIYGAGKALLTVKGEGQRSKYANREKEAIKAYFAIVGIPYNDANDRAFNHFFGGKKQKVKSGAVYSTVASDIVFIKIALRTTYAYLTEGGWTDKPAPSAKVDGKGRTVKMTAEQYDKYCKMLRSELPA